MFRYGSPMARSYSKIVADHRRAYPHQVRLKNADDWRADYCSRQHYVITGGVLALWFEREGSESLSVFGFTTAEQAAAFEAWTKTCGIDWSIRPREQPLPLPPKPPARPTTYAPTPEGRGTPARYRSSDAS